MIRDLLIDLDDTILDFHAAEKAALSRTLLHFHTEPTPEALDRYHEINRLHWEALERGELTRSQVLTGRFAQFFLEYGITGDPAACSCYYEGQLAFEPTLLPGARESLALLAGRYRIWLASNGAASVQHSRIALAGLEPLLSGVFISEEIGCEKPSPVFFRECFRRIPDFRKEETMMIGDSLTSDIRGGLNAGLITCWIAPDGKTAPAELRPHYQLPALSQLPGLLETL